MSSSSSSSSFSSFSSSLSAPSYNVDDIAGDIDDPNADRTSAWTAPISRSWDIGESSSSSPSSSVPSLPSLSSTLLPPQYLRKSKIPLSSSTIVEKGVIRYIYVIIDVSSSMSQNDLKPTRQSLTLDLLEDFVMEFFAQNPLSHMGFLVTHDGIAEKVSDLSGNPMEQIDKLRHFTALIRTTGEPSIQNSLEMAKNHLSTIPPYGTREILIISSSLSTCDSGDIYETLNSVIYHHITVNIIGLSAEVYLLSEITKRTNGQYRVIMGRDHYKEVLSSFIPPSPIEIDKQRGKIRRWIRMGFPIHSFDTFPSLCHCHKTFKYEGFTCPQCKGKYCELPTECTICSLTLVASPHLARSYHHLFPAAPFDVVEKEEVGGWGYIKDYTEEGREGNSDTSSPITISLSCYGCQRPLLPSLDLLLSCTSCHQLFCIDCDEFIHKDLHNCPGCLSGGRERGTWREKVERKYKKMMRMRGKEEEKKAEMGEGNQSNSNTDNNNKFTLKLKVKKENESEKGKELESDGDVIMTSTSSKKKNNRSKEKEDQEVIEI